jgi:membrane associated rhomboid family serine protease
MPDPSFHSLESILRLCAEKAPEPWYPSTYAKETGTTRDGLDPHLDQLRMAGLIRLTDWVAGQGQGYALTPAGEEILQNPRQLARLAAGKWSPAVVRENRPTASASSPWERGEAVRAALLYPVQPVVTFVLIAVNVGIYLLEFQYPQIYDIFKASPAGLLRNEWLRLVTTAFLHGGPLHLGMNMYALYALGQNAERIWGHWRYLVVYFVGAIGSTCLALITQPIPCIGASGAICGIFAAEAAWVYYHRQHLDPRLFFSWQRNFMINLVLIVFVSFFPGVSWAGHLGGAIAGLLIALWLNYFQFQPGWRRWLQWVGVVVIPLLSICLLLRTMRSSSKWLEIRARVEVLDFEKNFIPRDQSFLKQLEKMLDETNVADVLEQHPTRRDSRQVEDAIAGLKTAITSLEEERDELSRAGPYTTPKVKDAQRLGLRYLQSLTTYLQVMAECLEKGKNWTEKDEDRMLQQKKEMNSALEEWQALVR